MELNDPILKPEEAKDTTMNQEPISAAETANAEVAEVVEMTVSGCRTCFGRDNGGTDGSSIG